MGTRLFLPLMLITAACAAAPAFAAERRKDDAKDRAARAAAIAATVATAERLAVGDRLQLVVVGEADLTKEFVIDEAGSVALPLLGAVPAKGLTPAELEANLRTRLARYIRDPKVTLSASQRFAVAGGVHTPGPVNFPKGHVVRVLDVITAAGGFVDRAHKERVLIVRRSSDGAPPQSVLVDVKSYLRKGKETDNPLLLPNDLVYVDVAAPPGEKRNILDRALPFLRFLLL